MAENTAMSHTVGFSFSMTVEFQTIFYIVLLYFKVVVYNTLHT